MSYFDLKICRIPIGYTHKPTEHSDRETGKVSHSVPVEVEAMPFSWWLDQWATERGELQGDAAICHCEFTDNGAYGDGVQFSIFVGDVRNPIVSTGIPDDSLDMLIEALTAIRNLRLAEVSA